MLAGIVTADGDQAAEVGHEALRAGVAARGSRSPRGSPVSTSPCCSSSCRRRPPRAGGSGPTPWIARSSASRTNAVVSPGADAGRAAGPAAALRAGDAHAAHAYGPWPPTRPLRWRACRVEPPPVALGVPRPGARRPRRRPGRGRRRPRAGHAAGGLPARALPDAVDDRPGQPIALVLARCDAGCCRWTGCGSPGRCAGRAGDFEIRVDTAFDEVVDACADPRRPRGWIDARRSARRTSGCTSSAGCTRSRPGATAGWSAGCTAWRSAACSPASRCSTARPTPRRSRWSALVDLLRDEHADATRCSTSSGAPRTWPRSGWWRSAGTPTSPALRRARGAAPGRLRLRRRADAPRRVHPGSADGSRAGQGD